MLKILKNFLNKLLYIRKLYREQVANKKSMRFPPGHFYSPVVLNDEVKTNEDKIWKRVFPEDIIGIDLNPNHQKELVKTLSTYYEELSFKKQASEGLRYYYENKFYSYIDGIMLYSMLRQLKPNAVIEIGSVYSSALMLDVNEKFF